MGNLSQCRQGHKGDKISSDLFASVRTNFQSFLENQNCFREFADFKSNSLGYKSRPTEYNFL